MESIEKEIRTLKWELDFARKYLRINQDDLIVYGAILRGTIENPGVDLEQVRLHIANAKMMIAKYEKDLATGEARLALMEQLKAAEGVAA